MNAREAGRRRSDAHELEPCPDYFAKARRRRANRGSVRLHDAMQEAFFRFEAEHGLECGEGQFLLLETGVRL